MARPHVQFRLPESLYPHVLAFKAEHGLNDTGAMVRMIESFFGVGNHVKPERLPKTPKRKAAWSPLSAHTKARLTVLRFLEHKGVATTSDLAAATGQMTGNVAKRVKELADEGYTMETGEYRKSNDSGKMLTLWKRSAKPFLVFT